jgi:YggT family protein
MFIAGNFLSALGGVLGWVLWAYMWLIIIRALLSWVNPDPWNPIVQFINRATEPVLAPLRRLLPSWQWGIDFSPVLAILVIYFIQRFLVGSIMDLAWRLR